MIYGKKPSKPVIVHPLDRVTAHQDDAKLSRTAKYRLAAGRVCCGDAKKIECKCLLAIECASHGKHCFGPHEWPWEAHPNEAA